MLTIQELKSRQPELPQKVAEVVQCHMQSRWTKGGEWDAPGLTITSFHLSQLQTSTKVCPPVARAMAPAGNGAHLVLFGRSRVQFRELFSVRHRED